MNEGCKLTTKKRITIGSGTIIGQNVLIYDHDHDYHSPETLHGEYLISSISIGENVWIVSSAIILRGAVIEDDAVIDACSIIKGYIAKETLVYPQQSLMKREIKG